MKTCHQCGAQYEDEASFCLRDGTPLPDEKAQMIGRILDGQYEIEAFIAEGGMGAVYRARHTLLGDRVAIKILPPLMRRNNEWLKRFQREGQAARRFHHPNSVIVHDLRTSAEGEVYLVMEYVEGRTLDAELAAHGGRLAPAEILRFIEPVASVLDAAHAMGVVHRDLKPSNIMLTERGVVKLLDLGIAKLSDLENADVRLTTAGQLLGTPYYMSPEQWGELQRDGRVEVDGRADVYSLGVVVYEMTTGQRPFEAKSAIELRHAHCRLAPRSPAELIHGLPTAWANAVLHALAKDRSDRQSSAGDFVRELRASLGAGATDESVARAFAPTIINPPGETHAALALETPANLHRPTVQGYAQAVTQPQSPQTAPFQPSSALASVQTQRKTNSRSLLIIGAIILMVVGAMAAGGYAVWKMKADTKAQNSTVATDDNRSTSDEVDNSAGGDEKVASASDAFMRYHLLLGTSVLDLQQRATGREAVKPGQSLQLVFKPSEDGYLYVIGQDSGGRPVVMPTAMLKSELQVTAGEEVEVPQLAAIKLNDEPGTDGFTIIFTEQPLKLPFASETLPLDGSFRKLTADERQKIDELRRAGAPLKIEYTTDDGGTALIKLAEERGSKPVVFDIKLKLER
jgi:eukaryotic-like serine/threonine-protein kinase